MAHAQNSESTPSNTATTDAESYEQAQYCGRALMKVRTEGAEMEIEDSKTLPSLH